MYDENTNIIERQTINIIERLDDDNKLFVLDFAKFIEQKQLIDKQSRNAAYLDKIQRGIDQCSEGRGLVRDIIEVSEHD
jgi:hypothetical protein